MSELPQGWAEVTLGDVISPRGEKALPSDLGGIPFVGMDHIEAHTSRLLATRPVSELKSAVSIFKEGDVLYGRLRPYLNKVHEAEFDGTASAEFIILPQSVAIESRYLALTLRDSAFVQFSSQRSTGDRPRVKFESVSDYSFPLPPRAEQRRIVAKLDSLFERTRRAREELFHVPLLVEHYKQAILEKAFRGDLTADWRADQKDRGQPIDAKEFERDSEKAKSGLRGSRLALSKLSSEKEIVGAIPDGWRYARLIDIIDLKVGFAFKSAWFREKGIPLVRGVNIAPGYLSWAETVCLDESEVHGYSEYLIEPDDILLAMDRPLISAGLKIAIAKDKETPSLLVQRVARIRPNKWTCMRYLWWFLNGPMFLNNAVERATGTDLPHISGNDIALTPVPVPPISEQEEIVRYIDEQLASLSQCDVEAKKAELLLDHLDEANLSKAFRGELVAQDPDDEPASTLLERIRASRAVAPVKRRRRNTDRKAKMTKLTTEALKKIIQNLPGDRFSFDDLRGHVPPDYETLKDNIFALLAEENPSVRQIFDTEAQALRFERVSS